MARIRTIKPEFPMSETLGRISRDARLVFVNLWTIADDEGKARAASRMLASLLFPYDDDAPALMPGWLDELEDAGCIERHMVDGCSYLQITKWLKHQKIDKPSPSKLPQFDEASRVIREPSALDLGPRTKDQGPGPILPSVGVSAIEISEKPRSASKAPPEKSARLSRIRADWQPDAAGIEFAKARGVPKSEVQRFRDHHLSAGKPMLDWAAAWRKWCGNEVKFGKAPGIDANVTSLFSASNPAGRNVTPMSGAL